MSTSREVHDFLLANRPEGASHPDDCEFCTETPEQEETEVAGEDKIFTQEQHQSLLASAVQKAVDEATAKVDQEVLSLNERLKAAEETIAERDKTVEELKSSIAERDEAERLQKLADERATQVQEVAKFSDEQVATRKPGWAKMDEESFKAYLSDIAEVAKASGDTKTPPKTDFDGTRETAGAKGKEESAIGAFFGDADVLAAARS